MKLYQSRNPPITFFLSLPQLQLTFALASLFLRLFSICPCGSHRLLFVFPSSARANRTVHCSFIVRSLFVHCSFIVRSLFVLCSFFVRSLFVLCSFFVRLLFVFCSSFLYLPVRLALSARVARTVLRLPVRLVPLTLHFSLNCFPILIKILHRDFFPVKANIFKLFRYLTTFAYNDDSEIF